MAFGLDVDEPQVLAAIEGYPETWQHRLLLRRIKESRWVALGPSGGLEVMDLGGFELFPLARGAAVQARVAGDCAMISPLTDGELLGRHAAATRLAVIMGAEGVPGAPAAGSGVCWRIADTSALEFGQEVPSDEVASAGVVKGAVALVYWGEPRRWLFAELVPSAEYASWERDKQSGAGRDRRLLPARGSDFGSGLVPLSQAADHFRPTDLAKIGDWPHSGPRAVIELVRGVVALGLTLFTYHAHWVRQAGVHGESGIALEHRIHCQVLALALGYDCLDASSLASLELLARRVLQIERAVRVNPKAPSFQGLAKMTEHAPDEGGGLATREFTAHMAALAEQEARALKQNRLLREELAGSGQSSARRRVSLVNDVAQCPDLLVSDAAVALSALREAVERLRASSSPLLADWSVPSGKDALADLLHSDDLYAVAAGAALGSYGIDKPRVSRGDLVPKDVASVTSPAAAKLIDAPHMHILKSDAELCADVDSGALRGQPYWDPILRGSRAKKLEFLRAVPTAGLLTWRRRVRCRVGCFFVKKKDSMLRLVIDARWANRMCRAPPLSQLAVPGALARLSASDESFRMVQERLGRTAQANLDSAGDDELVGFSIDLTDGFYQFKCEALASMLGLGYTGTASSIADEFGIALDAVFDDDLQAVDPVDPSEVLEACFLGMAMGWSWALYFCNEAISECMREARCGRLVYPMCWSAIGNALAPYVDNANMLAVGRDEGRRVFDFVLAALRRRGFALRGRVDGGPVFEFLGLVLDGPRRRLRHSQKRCWRLWSALGRALTLGRLSGDAMRVLCGHLCHRFGLRPPLLSILQRVYAFAREQLGTLAPLPSDVWDELWVARSMLPFADADLRRPLCRTIWRSDASRFECALHEAKAGLAEVFDAAQWKERWRFREVVEYVDRWPSDVLAAAVIGPDAGQDWATVMVGALREDTRAPSAAVAEPSRLGAHCRQFERLLAQERGRACNYALSSCCREAAAWQLAAGVDWRRRCVDTDRNPSDRGSRLGDRGKLSPRGTVTPRGPGRQRARRRADAASDFLQRDLVSAAQATVAPAAPEQGVAAEERRCGGGPEAAQPSARRQAGRFVLGLFAGCAHLSGAALQAGLDVAVPFELDSGLQFDILRPGTLGFIVEWIRQGRVWWVHLGTPCAWASHARSTGSPEAPAARAGLSCALASVRILRAVLAVSSKYKIYVTVENPITSRLWVWRPMQTILDKLGRSCIDFDLFAAAAGPPGAGLSWRPPPVLGQRQGSYVRLDARLPLSSAGGAPPKLGVSAPLPSGGALDLVAGAARPRPAPKAAVAKRRAAHGDVTAVAPVGTTETQPAPQPAVAIKRPASGGAASAGPMAKRARPAAATPAGQSREERASRRAAEGASPSDLSLTMPELRSTGKETKDRYSAAFEEFQAWAGQRGQSVMKLAKDADNLDAVLVAFLGELYLRGEATSIARHVLFGAMFELGLGQGPNAPPRCRRSLQGFRRDDPPVSEDPCPREAAALVVSALLKDGSLLSVLSGLAFGVQYDLFAWPSETLNILREGVVAPRAGAYQGVAAIVAPGPRARGCRGGCRARRLVSARAVDADGTKSGEFDDAALAGPKGLGFEFAPEVLLSLPRCALPGQPLFSPLTLGECERHILKGAELAGLDPLRVTPHSARRGGASSAMHLQLLDLQMIQKRGRWLAPRSVKRHGKSGKLLRQAAAIRHKIPMGAALLDPASRDSLRKQMLAAANSIRRLRAQANT
ncbi:unnamed protein product [Prorocentrum cordatum]|uniref:Uncharacterized protein n=1 Tax=Prorocentrum cordatum TaxID=2364126 RepID=A0ABN9WXM7_9DINO|nr:unnamed protein product [Polarella glacialis]